MYIINIKDVKELKTPHGKSIRWLLPVEIGAPNFEMRYFEVIRESKPSKDKHPWEHEVFVVRGEGIVKSEGLEKKVKPGDAIFIPPNEPHMFLSAKEEPFGFICVIPKGCEDRMKDKKRLKEIPPSFERMKDFLLSFGSERMKSFLKGGSHETSRTR